MEQATESCRPRPGAVEDGARFGVPDALREVARFPEGAPAQARAEVWAEVLTLAARELASISRSSGSWPDAARASLVSKIDEGVRLSGAAKAPLLAAQERAGEWRGTGARRFEDYVAIRSRSGKGQARRDVRAARTIDELDGGHEALVDGTLTLTHVDQLGTVLGKLPEEKRELLLTDEGAAKIKTLARRHDANGFGNRLEALAASLMPKAVEDEHQSARSRRHLELAPTPDGMTRITGLLDAVAGHTLRLAIDAASPHPGEDDERTPAQRAADALTSIASNSLHAAKASGNARAQILITMTADTFAQARAHLAAGGPLSDDGAARLGPAPSVRCQDGPLLPPSELARVLCDSEIGRLVIGADGELLDLGRSARLYSPAQRRAVIARDQGCFWDGCTIPARYCEVHHLDWWDEDRGHTDVRRGVLACTFHHGQLHSRKLDATMVDGLRDQVGDHVRDQVRDQVPGDEEPPLDGGGLLPGDPEYSPPTYKVLPRTTTHKQREEARRDRLLEEIRAGADGRRARLREQSPPGARPPRRSEASRRAAQPSLDLAPSGELQE